MQPNLDDRAFDFARPGKRSASTSTAQAMVTRSPIRVKALIDLLRSDWDRKYSREVAAYPFGVDPEMAHKGKYWPATGRIDGVFGDRNLICSCTPIEELAIN